MSKFLNLGLSLDDVIFRSTWNPARIIHREQLGHLTPGAIADLAILRLDRGQYGFTDSFGARLDGSQNLVGELTIASGKVVWDLNGRTREPWHKLGSYEGLGESFWDGTRGSWKALPLK